jgi:hypothetical protein
MYIPQSRTEEAFFPDLIFFRDTPSGIIADLVDAHLLARLASALI